MKKNSYYQKLKYLKKYLKKQQGLERKIKFCHFYNLAYKNGVANSRLERISTEYTDDYFADTGVSRPEKEWYYQRGIPTFKKDWYGLTKDNYNDFISDFDFYNADNYLHNRQLIRWFDYKLTTYYVLSPFKAFMPQHFFYIEHGELVPMDIELNRYGKAEDVFELVTKTPIALKSCSGGHGKGFYKLVERSGKYYVNNKETSAQDVSSLIASLDDYILTEYSVLHKVFRDACGEDSFAVLRTVSVFDKNDGPQITAILIRLGSSAAGLVSDYDGCINCGVDLETGKLFGPVMRGGDDQGIIIGTPVKAHPDTGVDLETLTVPRFDELTDLVKKVSAHLAMTPYLVMDIIPTDDGFDLLEINSHGQVRILENFFPFRKNKYNLNAFKTRDW